MQDGVIFVFGSNLSGKHGKGAALDAKRSWGAIQLQGQGRQGNAYAIPTKGFAAFGLPTLGLPTIHRYILEFLGYARRYPELLFKVTRIGCGLAGYSNQQIAPMFGTAPPNCGFDPAWAEFDLPSWAEVGIHG